MAHPCATQLVITGTAPAEQHEGQTQLVVPTWVGDDGTAKQSASPQLSEDGDRFHKVYIAAIPRLMGEYNWLYQPNEDKPGQTIFVIAKPLELVLPLQIRYGFRKFAGRTGKLDVANGPISLSGCFGGDESYEWFHSSVYDIERLDQVRKDVLPALKVAYDLHQKYLAVPIGSKPAEDVLDSDISSVYIPPGDISKIGIDPTKVDACMQAQEVGEGHTRYHYRIMLPLGTGYPRDLCYTSKNQAMWISVVNMKVKQPQKLLNGLGVIEGLEPYLKNYNIIMKGTFMLAIELRTKLVSSEATKMPYYAGLVPIKALMCLLPKSHADVAHWVEGTSPQKIDPKVESLLASIEGPTEL